MKKIRCYMGIPTTGVMVDSLPFKLREIEKRYGDRVEFVYPEILVRRIFHDYARNEIVEEFLASDCDVLWFIDSDVSPPEYIGEMLTTYYNQWEAAGAPYPVFMPPKSGDLAQLVFTVYKKNVHGGLTPCEVPYEGTEFVDGLGTGCMFLKRSVFEKLKKPYFEFKYNPETRAPIEGEDLGFCLKLSALGIKFFIDYSFVCKHLKTVCLLDMNNYAMEYAKKSLDAYQRELRAAVTKKYSRKTGAPLPIPKTKLVLPSGLR
jgi:hypothetical protein